MRALERFRLCFGVETLRRGALERIWLASRRFVRWRQHNKRRFQHESPRGARKRLNGHGRHERGSIRLGASKSTRTTNNPL